MLNVGLNLTQNPNKFDKLKTQLINNLDNPSEINFINLQSENDIKNEHISDFEYLEHLDQLYLHEPSWYVVRQEHVHWEDREEVDEEPAREIGYGGLARVHHNLRLGVDEARAESHQEIQEVQEVDTNVHVHAAPRVAHGVDGLKVEQVLLLLLRAVHFWQERDVVRHEKPVEDGDGDGANVPSQLEP